MGAGGWEGWPKGRRRRARCEGLGEVESSEGSEGSEGREARWWRLYRLAFVSLTPKASQKTKTTRPRGTSRARDARYNVALKDKVESGVLSEGVPSAAATVRAAVPSGLSTRGAASREPSFAVAEQRQGVWARWVPWSWAYPGSLACPVIY